MTTQLVTALSVAAIVASAVSVSPATPTEPDTGGGTAEIRTIGTVRSSATPFHPDYSRALTVEQMTAAWNAEIDRVFPVPVTGGG
jgi:hypothetical protein